MPTYRITGKEAAIDGLHCLRNFRLQLKGVDTKSACSASAGAVLRTSGNADWSVVATGYGLPAKYPGEFCTFEGNDRNHVGWKSGDEDGAGTGALVDWVKIFCPIEAGKHIYHQIRLLGNGSIAKGDAYIATDAAAPTPLNPKGLLFKIDGTSVSGVLGVAVRDFRQLDRSGLPELPGRLAGPGRGGRGRHDFLGTDVRRIEPVPGHQRLQHLQTLHHGFPVLRSEVGPTAGIARGV
jgi:hypothetical protein